MLPRILEVKHEKHYQIWLRFEHGTAGEVDLADESWGEIFASFNDPAAFRQVKLDQELGTIVRPNGADFAPELLYEKLWPDYSLEGSAEREPGAALHGDW